MKFRWCCEDVEGFARHSRCPSVIGYVRRYKVKVVSHGKKKKVKRSYRDVMHCECWCHVDEDRPLYADVLEQEKAAGCDLFG